MRPRLSPRHRRGHRRACIQKDLEPEDLDKRLDAFGWQDAWDNFIGPQAKAFHLLKGLDLASGTKFEA